MTNLSNARSCKRATKYTSMMAKSTLKLANIIRYEGGHKIIDVSLLRTIPDSELMRYRNVGKATIEKIQEIRKSLDWL